MTEENVLRNALALHAERRQGGQEVLAALRNTEPARGRGRTGWVAAGALAATGVVVAGSVLWGGGSAAYAVSRNADGTVTVSIEDVAAIGPANEALREFGLRVKAVPMTADCPGVDGATIYRGSDWASPDRSGNSVTLSPRIPEGYTVLLAVSRHPNRGSGLGYTAPLKDPAPSCVLDPADDPEYRSPN
jgi:hypothetical protein